MMVWWWSWQPVVIVPMIAFVFVNPCFGMAHLNVMVPVSKLISRIKNSEKEKTYHTQSGKGHYVSFVILVVCWEFPTQFKSSWV